MDTRYPSEETRKRLLAQYVPEDRLDVDHLLKYIPTGILLPLRPIHSYKLVIERNSITTISYIDDDGVVWYSLSHQDYAEAVGQFLAYLLEYDKGDAWWRMPGHPDYRRGKNA